MPEKGTTKGELPPEVDKYLAALVKDPKSKAFVPLADAYRKAGMLDEAIQVAKDGLKYNPGYISGRFVLGRCYYEKEMFKEAEEELQRVVKSNPENADAQRLLARIQEKQGRLEEAIKTWDIVLTLVSNDGEAKQRIEELRKQLAPPKEEKKQEPELTQKPEEKPEEPIAPEPSSAEVSMEEPTQMQEQVKAIEEGLGAPEMVGEEEKAEAEKGEEKIGEKVEAEVEGEVKVEAKVEGEVKVEEKIEEEKKERLEQVSSIGVQEGAQAELREHSPVSSADACAIEVSESVSLEPSSIDKHVVKDAGISIGAPEIPKETKEVKQSEPQVEEVSRETHAPAPEKDVSTRALADMYFKQGYYERALKVYRELEALTPGDQEIKSRIKFIEEELKKKGAPEPGEAKFKENIKTLSSWLDKIKRGG